MEGVSLKEEEKDPEEGGDRSGFRPGPPTDAVTITTPARAKAKAGSSGGGGKRDGAVGRPNPDDPPEDPDGAEGRVGVGEAVVAGGGAGGAVLRRGLLPVDDPQIHRPLFGLHSRAHTRGQSHASTYSTHAQTRARAQMHGRKMRATRARPCLRVR